MKIDKLLGLRNTTTTERLKPGELEIGVNVDLDDTGHVARRSGQTTRVAGASHSLWSRDELCFFVQDKVLYRLGADAVSKTQVAALQSNNPVSFARLGERVFFANGVDQGVITGVQARAWGVAPPVSQPVATPDAGNLPAGVYQYALVFMRADGHESGTGLAGTVTLPATGGIRFSNIEVSTNPAVASKLLYVSTPGGEVLYRAATIPAGATSYTYSNGAADFNATLRTQFRVPPPKGRFVLEWRGHLLVANENTVWYSFPYEPEHFDLGGRFWQFQRDIRMIVGVDAGVFISTDTETVFLAGASPETVKPRPAQPFSAIEGTAVLCRASMFSDEASADAQAVVWVSQRGVCVGMPDGSITNLTEQQYTFPAAPRGAGVVREKDGIVQYLGVLQGAV